MKIRTCPACAKNARKTPEKPRNQETITTAPINNVMLISHLLSSKKYMKLNMEQLLWMETAMIYATYDSI